jgi:hypothetical protein
MQFVCAQPQQVSQQLFGAQAQNSFIAQNYQPLNQNQSNSGFMQSQAGFVNNGAGNLIQSHQYLGAQMSQN